MRYSFCVLAVILATANDGAGCWRHRSLPQTNYQPVSHQSEPVYHSLYQTVQGRVKDEDYVRGFDYRIIRLNKVPSGKPLFLPLIDGGIFLEKYRYKDALSVDIYRWGGSYPKDGGIIVVMGDSICGLIHKDGIQYHIMKLEGKGDEHIVARIK